MKITEIRIGNAVLTGFNETIIISTIIHKKNTEGYFLSTLKPIKTTEETLFKLGLKKYEDADIPTYYIKFGNFIEDDFEYCFMIFQDINKDYYTQIFGKKIMLNQIHKIQNLFYEITDEELTFKSE